MVVRLSYLLDILRICEEKVSRDLKVSEVLLLGSTSWVGGSTGGLATAPRAHERARGPVNIITGTRGRVLVGVLTSASWEGELGGDPMASLDFKSHAYSCAFIAMAGMGSLPSHYSAEGKRFWNWV